MTPTLAHGGQAAANMSLYRAYKATSDYIGLDDIEYKSAIYTGRLIWLASQQRGLRDYHGSKQGGADGQRWQELGSVAERALAKYLKVYWGGGYNSFRGADLLDNIEVRLIGAESYGLRVRDTDADHKYVVGVVIPKGQERNPYRLPGFMKASEAKEHREWRMNPYEGRPFYGIPQAHLHPIWELVRLLGEKKAS